MARNDWIPGREQDFVDLCEKWKSALEDQGKISAYGWDQADSLTILNRITVYLNTRSNYESDNSSARRLAKDDAKKAVVDVMRYFANSSIRYNKSMNAQQKLALGIRPKDATPTAHGKPESQPDTVVENTVNHFEHKVRALNHATGKTVKPADAYGVCYVWQVGGEKPASGADIRGQTKFSRRASMVVTHTEADKGKPCFYSCCYENGKGDQGSWSPVEEAVIG